MKKIALFLAITFAMIQFSGCNKTKVVPKSKTDILVLNTWQISTASIDPGFATIAIYKKDATNNLFDVSKITLSFKKDGSITATDQNGKAIAGTWALNSDETAVTLPAGLPFKEVKIVTLTESNFDVSVTNFEYTVLGQTVKGILAVNMIPKF
jgi:hypothetical protein